MKLCLSPGKLYLTLAIEEAAPLAKQAGFDALEFALTPEQDPARVRDLLDRCDLEAGTHWIPAPLWREPTEPAYRENVEQLAKLMPGLVAVGVRQLAVWILPASDTLPYRENFEWHVQHLGPVARLAAEHDMQLAMEFIGPRTMRDGHRYSFIHTLGQTLELCEALGENVGVQLDAWHWHCSLGTLDDIRAIPRSRLVGLHINDAPAGVPIEQLMDQVRQLPAATGVIDIGGFFEAVRSVGFHGQVVAEPFDASLRGQPAEQVVMRAMASIRAALEARPKPALPTMQRALATRAGKAWTVEMPVPRPRGNQVIVKLHTSLICGSNMRRFVEDQECINGGHEGAGEVVAVAHSTRLKVGDRVALSPLNACGHCEYCHRGEVILCRHRPVFTGHFCQYTCVADVMCTVLPEDISLSHGALLGCGLGPAYGALKQVGAAAFDTLVITGLGPVGLGTVALATFMNVRVVAVEIEPYRRRVAQQLGAQVVLDPSAEGFTEALREAVGGYGLLKGIECSGAAAAQRMLIDQAAPMARLAFIGENHKAIDVCPSADLIRKHLTITGVWHMNQHDQGDLITFLRRAPEKADLLITHRFGFDEAQRAFETFASRQAVKVALDPQRV